MDKATSNKAVIADGAHFKGQIKNARAIEINGTVEADLKADKVTVGSDGKFVGAINGHASKKSEVLFLTDGVELNLHHIAFRCVHDLTEPPLLLDVIAGLQ